MLRQGSYRSRSATLSPRPRLLGESSADAGLRMVLRHGFLYTSAPGFRLQLDARDGVAVDATAGWVER